MFKTTPALRRSVVVSLSAVTFLLAFSIPASTAKKDLFFEETATAFWEVPHTCADGTIVPGTLLVSSTRDFESPETEDSDPTARVQFLAVCPDGISFSWGAVLPAIIESTTNLKSVTAVAMGAARDNIGGTHDVSFDIAWTGFGPLETTVNGPGSKRKEREATATGQVTFDGVLLVNGQNNHPTRPAPFIRVDTEK